MMTFAKLFNCLSPRKVFLLSPEKKQIRLRFLLLRDKMDNLFFKSDAV
jgi:hypothetical protein